MDKRPRDKGSRRNFREDITERKKAEKILKESEEKYRILAETSTDGILTTDKVGILTYTNPALESMFGIPSSAALRTHFSKYVTKKSALKAMRLFLNLAGRKSESVRNVELTAVHKDKHAFPIEVSASSMIRDGKFEGIECIVRDVTERKKAEEVLKESEERYRTLIENSHDMIQSVGTDGHFKFVNKAWHDTLGYTREELPKLTMFDIIHPDSLEHCKKTFQQVMAGKSVNNIEAKFTAKDGRAIFVEGNASPRYMGGKIVSTQGFFRDVTERKKIEGLFEQQRHELGERIKEIGCLYGVDEISRKKGVTTEEILKETVRLMPPGWQYPKITGARITFEDKEYKTGNFRETEWVQRADITVNGKKAGSIEVCYLDEKSESDEGPFLKEERNLVNALAKRLAQIIENRRADDELRESKRKLEEKVHDLERFSKAGVGRELRMVELKNSIKELEEKLKSAGLK